MFQFPIEDGCKAKLADEMWALMEKQHE